MLCRAPEQANVYRTPMQLLSTTRPPGFSNQSPMSLSSTCCAQNLLAMLRANSFIRGPLFIYISAYFRKNASKRNTLRTEGRTRWKRTYDASSFAQL